MFILRIIPNDTAIEENHILGRNYRLVLKNESPEAFKKSSLSFWKTETPENTFGFIWDEKGNINPIYKNSHYYIMTGDGQTFKNISYKE